MIRIDKYLSNMGKGSRSELLKVIKKGTVNVNGKIVKDPSFKVDETKDTVIFMGEEVTFKKNLYIMLNKPKGYITATEDDYNKNAVLLTHSSGYLTPKHFFICYDISENEYFGN